MLTEKQVLPELLDIFDDIVNIEREIIANMIVGNWENAETWREKSAEPISRLKQHFALLLKE